MQRFLNKKQAFFILLPLIILCFFQKNYGENSYWLFILNISWLFLLYKLLTKPLTYILFFSGIMLFLGFWMKFTLISVFNLPFYEKMGYWLSYFDVKFNYFGQINLFIPKTAYVQTAKILLNHVIQVSALVAITYLCVYFLIALIFLKKKTFKNKNNLQIFIYKKYRKSLWVFLILSTLFLTLLNYHYNFYKAGFAQKVVLPFHLNAIFIWAIIFLPSLLSCSLAFFDKELTKKGFNAYFMIFIIFYVFLCLTTLSRLMFPMLIIPLMIAMFVESNLNVYKFIINHKIFILISFIAIIFISLLINFNRMSDYASAFNNNSLSNNKTPSYQETPIKYIRYNPIIKNLYVFTHRWVGLEAVMATTAYPNTGMDLLWQGLQEKPSPNDKIGIYNNIMLLSASEQFRQINSKGYIFSSLPGLVAILNYSNSLLIIFTGLFLILLVLNILELLSGFLLNNTYLIAVQSFMFSYYCISGLNIPYLGLINLLEIVMFTLMLFILLKTSKICTKNVIKAPIKH